MKNFITNRPYTGVNEGILAEAGVDAVLTFKQALSLEGVSGKSLKGIKSCATLIRFSKNEEEVDENGVSKPKAIFFSVFDAADVVARQKACLNSVESL